MFLADLKVLSGKHQGKVITLASKKFLVGRGEDCHMRPNNDLISRHHCVFTCDDYSVRLRDLGSTNGTFVNDQQVQGQVVLKTGDRVRIGKLDFEVVVKEGAPVEASVAAAAEQEPVIPIELPDESAVQAAPEAGTGSETMYEMPTPAQILPASGDTGVISASETSFMPAPQVPVPQMPVQQPPPPLQYAPGAIPPGYGYPPGYVPQAMPPGMPPQAMMPPGQYPYPQQPMPGYPGYPAQPMMPPNPAAGYGYPVPPVGQPAMVPEPEPEASSSSSGELPVKLPDPSATGAVGEEKPAEAKQDSGGAPVETPSTKAGDIIQQMTRRRPS